MLYEVIRDFIVVVALLTMAPIAAQIRKLFSFRLRRGDCDSELYLTNVSIQYWESV